MLGINYGDGIVYANAFKHTDTRMTACASAGALSGIHLACSAELAKKNIATL